MKKNNMILLAGAALLLYFLMRKKATAAAIPAQVVSTEGLPLPPNVQEVKSQTVNFEQLAPSPSMVMDMPTVTVQPQMIQRPCSCNDGRGTMSGMPFIC